MRGDEQLGDHPQGVDRGPPHVLGRQRRVDDPDGCLKALRKPLHPVQAVPVDPDPQLLDSHAGHGRPNRETVGLFDMEDLPVVPIPDRIDLEGDPLAGIVLPDEPARPGSRLRLLLGPSVL